jgi:hypothetical protein
MMDARATVKNMIVAGTVTAIFTQVLPEGEGDLERAVRESHRNLGMVTAGSSHRSMVSPPCRGTCLLFPEDGSLQVEP